MEYKFRGKRVDNGEWVCGYYVEIDNGKILDGHKVSAIFTDNGYRREVIPETVGQFTGLKDKNGVDIYEGDILQSIDTGSIWSVEYKTDGITHPGFTMLSCVKNIKVIGNTTDNPELLTK